MPNGELNNIEIELSQICLQNQKNEEILCGPIMKEYI
jgi:hypothetical protein